MSHYMLIVHMRHLEYNCHRLRYSRLDHFIIGQNGLPYYEFNIFFVINAYPTFGNPKMPHFRDVPTRPIRGGSLTSVCFFFGGIFHSAESGRIKLLMSYISMLHLKGKPLKCVHFKMSDGHGGHPGQVATLDRWPPWTGGHPGQVATLDRWQPWTSGNPGQVATLDRWQPWTSGHPGQVATLDRSFIMFNIGSTSIIFYLC